MADLTPMQQFTGSTDFQELTPEERAQAVRRFQGLSVREQQAFVQDLVPATQPTGTAPALPNIATRAQAAVPEATQAAIQGSQGVGAMLGTVAGNVARQVAAATPLNPLAKVVQALRRPQDDGTRSFADRALDILSYQPTPQEIAAQAVFMGITGGLGGVLGTVRPGLAPIVEPLLSLGAHDVNVRLGLSEPGALGYLGSAALPLAVRGAGATAGFLARRSTAGQLMRDYDAAVTQRNNTMLQQDLTRSNALAKEAAAYEQRVVTSLQEYLAALDARSATHATKQAALARVKAAREAREAFRARQYQEALDLRAQRIQENAEAAAQLQEVSALPWGGARAQARAQIRAAYDRVTTLGDPEIPWDNVRKVAQEVMDEIALTVLQFQDHPLHRVASGLRDMGTRVGASGESVVRNPLFSEVRPNLTQEALGGMAMRYMDRGGRTSGLIQKLKGTMLDAMAAGGGETNAALRQAAALARKDFALQDFEALVTPSAPGSAVHLTANNLLEVSPKILYNKLRALKNDPYWAKSFTAAELDRLDQGLTFLQGLEKIPRSPTAPPTTTAQLPLREVPFAPMPVPRAVTPPRDIPVNPPPLPVAMGSPEPPTLRRTMLSGSIGAGLGASLGYVSGAGYGTGSALGGVVGAAAPEIGRVISQALLSPRGQPLLRRLLARDLMIAPDELALLNAVLRKSTPAPPDASVAADDAARHARAQDAVSRFLTPRGPRTAE